MEKPTYKEIAEELSRYKVGDVIKRGNERLSRRYLLISALVRAGYVISCREECVVVCKEISSALTMQKLEKEKLDPDERIKRTLHYWIKLYNPKLRDYIIPFYAVYIFILESEGRYFRVVEIAKKHPVLNVNTIQVVVGLMSANGIVECTSKGYRQIAPMPDWMVDHNSLKNKKPSLKKKDEVKVNANYKPSPKNAFLYERAFRAGLIKR